MSFGQIIRSFVTCLLLVSGGWCLCDRSIADEFVWPEEIRKQLDSLHDTYRNGEFYVTATKNNVLFYEAKMRFRENDVQIEGQYIDQAPTVMVNRSDAFFRLEKNEKTNRWKPTHLNVRQHGMVGALPEPFFSFACRGVTLQEMSGSEIVYQPKSAFNIAAPFEVAWRFADGSKQSGTMLFDPKASWRCVEFTTQSNDEPPSVVRAEYTQKPDGLELSVIHLSRMKEQIDFAVVKITSEVPGSELFQLSYYDLSESLLAVEHASTFPFWIVPFLGIGTALLIVGLGSMVWGRSKRN